MSANDGGREKPLNSCFRILSSSEDQGVRLPAHKFSATKIQHQEFKRTSRLYVNSEQKQKIVFVYQ